MDAETTTRLKLLLAEAEEKGFVYYKELGRLLPRYYGGGTRTRRSSFAVGERWNRGRGRSEDRVGQRAA